nr:PhF00058.1 [Neoporphyra haitanensis]
MDPMTTVRKRCAGTGGRDGYEWDDAAAVSKRGGGRAGAQVAAARRRDTASGENRRGGIGATDSHAACKRAYGQPRPTAKAAAPRPPEPKTAAAACLDIPARRPNASSAGCKGSRRAGHPLTTVRSQRARTTAVTDAVASGAIVSTSAPMGALNRRRAPPLDRGGAGCGSSGTSMPSPPEVPPSPPHPPPTAGCIAAAANSLR